jgi:(p)ppGpp synthase/HD superfamily hydrolase
MHEVAEPGVAAHWTASTREAVDGQYRWLRELRHSRPCPPEEFLEHTKLEMFRTRSRVYPKAI